MKIGEYRPDSLDRPIRQCSMGRCCNESIIIKLKEEVSMLKIVAYSWIFISFILSLLILGLLGMP